MEALVIIEGHVDEVEKAKNIIEATRPANVTVHAAELAGAPAK